MLLCESRGIRWEMDFNVDILQTIDSDTNIYMADLSGLFIIFCNLLTSLFIYPFPW